MSKCGVKSTILSLNYKHLKFHHCGKYSFIFSWASSETWKPFHPVSSTCPHHRGQLLSSSPALTQAGSDPIQKGSSLDVTPSYGLYSPCVREVTSSQGFFSADWTSLCEWIKSGLQIKSTPEMLQMHVRNVFYMQTCSTASFYRSIEFSFPCVEKSQSNENVQFHLLKV